MRRLRQSIAALLLAVTVSLPLSQAWAAEEAAAPAKASQDAPAASAEAAVEPVSAPDNDAAGKAQDTLTAETPSDTIPPEEDAPPEPDPEAMPFNLGPSSSNKQSLPDVDISTGALAYAIPLRTPPGRRGVQPDIRLVYNSQNTEEGGLSGFGWNMALPSIERKNLNGFAKMFAAYDFSASSDGELKETGRNGAAVYFGAKTEAGAFSRYIFHEDASGGRWEVRTRQGMTYRFGSQPSARLSDPSVPAHVFRWYLDSAEDTLGNSVTYSYESIDGQVYPTAIAYTNSNGSEGLFRVAFLYEDRPVMASSAGSGFMVTTRRRLSRVETYIGADNAGVYALSYAPSSGNGRSLLTSIAYTGYDEKGNATDEPATQFGYGQGGAIDLMSTIIQPAGGRTDVAYLPAVRYLLSSGGPANPKLPFTLQTVNRISFDDAHGVTWQNSFRYEGGSYYYNGPFDRRFAGFERVVRSDARGTQSISYYHQGNGDNAAFGEKGDEAAKIGKTYKTEILAADSRLFGRIVNSWDSAPLAGQRSFVSLIQSLQSDYDGNATHRDKAVTYDYDPVSGNLIRTNEWGEVSANGNRFSDIGSDSYSNEFQYAGLANGLSYLSSQTRRDQAQNKVAESRHYYDGLPLGEATAGNETRTEQWISGTSYARSDTSYDDWGLAVSQRDPRRNETTFAYDDYGLYPITSTDPLGHVTAMAYDYSSGQKTQVIDPNGSAAATVYDGLDRPLQQLQSSPDDPAAKELAIAFEYDDTPGHTSVTQRQYLTADQAVDTYDYFDGFGRKVQERRRAGADDRFAVTDTLYAADDMVSKRSLPYFGSGSAYQLQALPEALYTSYAYDELHRPIAAVSAVGTETTAYDDWKTTFTDAAGMAKDTLADAYGNLAGVDEHNGGETYATRYEWNGLRKLVRLTDALGNIRNFAYDGLGRTTLSEDLHAPGDPKFGSWLYAYDAAGNLVRRVDPNGLAVAYAYDALNRMLTENAAEDNRIETANTYDTCRNGLGRLCRAETADAVVTDEYDLLGRTIAVTKQLVEGSFTSRYAYDRRGERVSLTNPDSSELRYAFDEGGRVNRIERKEASDQDFSAVVHITGFNPAGAPLTIEYGNGAVTDNRYDENELYRLRHKSTEARGQLVQDLEYAYDSVGDITRIADTSATETAKTVEYLYDGLHRLTQASISDATHSDGDNARQTFSYDAIGNIITKSDVGSYRYATDPGSFANPHAVIKAGDSDLDYDNNGNLVAERNRVTGEKTTYYWDYDNRLIRVSKVNGTSTYAYDAAGQRLRSDGPEGRNLTLSEEYSLQPQGADKHVFLDGTAVASVSGSGSKAAAYYIHTDHLAGSNVITAADQSIDELTDYYAFGSIRLDQKNSDRTEKRKFTGHEYDEGTGLTYANARYYDARIGRWISQDPLFEQMNYDLSSPQGMNSYSYALNNPLRYVDPDGQLSQESALNFLKGLGNAVASNNAFGFGRQSNDNSAFRTGQQVGDAIGLIQGAAEVAVAAADTTVGVAISATGVGVIVGAPMAVAGAVVATHGVAVASVSAYHLSESALNDGPKDTDVYIGSKNNKDTYVGISKNVEKRAAQHGERFDATRKVNPQPLTRNQARGVEQATIEKNPHFENKINSISPQKPLYEKALNFGKSFLGKLGL